MTLPTPSLPLPLTTIRQLDSLKLTHLSDVIPSVPWLECYDEKENKHQVDSLALPDVHKNALMDLVTNHLSCPTFIAVDSLSKNLPTSPVITFSAQLDNLLVGGVVPGEILEILGEPNSGTSQLCQQLAVDCSIPIVFGGRNCRALIIDCNGDICESRLLQIAKGAFDHLSHIARNEAERNAVLELTVDKMLGMVDTARCTDYTQLLALIHSLSKGCQYGMILIDTVATHFRHEFDDMRQRTNLLASLSNQLHSLCMRYGTSLVLVNQVRMTGEGSVVPCLGESWSHTAHRRLLLSKLTSDTYSATIMKGEKSGQTAKFRVSSRGIRDCNPA